MASFHSNNFASSDGTQFSDDRRSGLAKHWNHSKHQHQSSGSSCPDRSRPGKQVPPRFAPFCGCGDWSYGLAECNLEVRSQFVAFVALIALEQMPGDVRGLTCREPSPNVLFDQLFT